VLGCLGEWPDLAGVLTDSQNVWNQVLVQSFDENPNAENELKGVIQIILAQIESLDEVREWTASVGIEMQINSDASVADVFALAWISTENNSPK
jgi:beta-phosphoglucomutase-like phosphatase (HAD superfamily)